MPEGNKVFSFYFFTLLTAKCRLPGENVALFSHFIRGSYFSPLFYFFYRSLILNSSEIQTVCGCHYYYVAYGDVSTHEQRNSSGNYVIMKLTINRNQNTFQLYCVVLCCIVLYCVVLCCFVLFCIVLCCFVLF